MSEDKLLAFLEEFVIPRGNRKGKQDAEGKHPKLSKNSIIAYASAIVDLYQDQVKTMNNPYPAPRGDNIKSLIQNLTLTENDRHKAQFIDRGKGTAKDGYSQAEFEAIG